MKTKFTLIKRAALLVLLSTLIYQPSTLFAQGTAFTYQGQLQNNGSLGQRHLQPDLRAVQHQQHAVCPSPGR